MIKVDDCFERIQKPAENFGGGCWFQDREIRCQIVRITCIGGVLQPVVPEETITAALTREIRGKRC